MSPQAPSFPRLVRSTMADRGLGLRELCRRAELDPSFFSKVLAGKRSPPSEEGPLRRLAEALELPAVEVIVAAGRIPTDWGALLSDPELFRAVNALAGGSRKAPSPRAPAPERLPARDLSEELL